MAWTQPFFYLVLAFSLVHCRKDSDADTLKLPKLFHLDDFEKCLERKDGMYCLGQFEVYSDGPSPLYDLIQEKSQDIHLYNRSYLHRGLCLPTRCPSNEANATARFEHCVDASVRNRSLRARIHTLHYCRARGDPRPGATDTNDTAHKVVLYFACFLLVMAVVGTVYDFYIAKKGSKNPLLLSFSVRINWNHLTSNYQDVDPRLRQLEVINGYRFIMGIGMIYCHMYILTAAMYQHDPSVMEKILSSPYGYMLGSAMVATLSFLMISNFLTFYNILVLSDKIDFNFKLFPLLVLKRVIRVYPVYLLLNGFAATWYLQFGDGPMWPVLVANEGEVCRKKFWITAAFLQNFIDKKHICLVQTWIMAVDMQIHIFVLVLCLILNKHRKHALKILSVLLVGAIAWLAYEAFEKDLIPTYMFMTPEVFRTFFFNGAESFFDLYIHPINGVIVAIIGCMLAIILVDHTERGVDYSSSKIFIFIHWFGCPLLIGFWYLSFAYFRHFDRNMQHVMVVLERLFSGFITASNLYTLFRMKDSVVYKVFSWRALRVLMRLALSVSMCHWCINAWMLTGRWLLHETSVFRLKTDIINVYVLAHIVALPLTLFVEYPLQKFLDRVLNQTGIRWFYPLKAKSK